MPQSLAKLYVHLVFSTKDRTETLPKQHIEEVHSYIAGILNNNHCPAIQIGGTTNHIHILYIQSKTMTLSDTVRLVKSNSSKWINEKNGKFNVFAWQNGYGAFSISQSHIEAVRNYIKTQKEHHSKINFKDEFRRLCEIYDAPLDEQYARD